MGFEAYEAFPIDPQGLTNRRSFLKSALGCMAGASTLAAFSTPPVWGSELKAPLRDFWSSPRWVWLRRAATGEEIRLTYWSDGHLHDQAYRQISWFMRDRRFETLINSNSPTISKAVKLGEIAQNQLTPWALMDPIVIDILYAYCAWLFAYGVPKPVEITSGFRHFLTNAMTEGAARDSWHTKAGAADLFVPGVPIEQVSRFGTWLAGGGVGLYRNKNFTHVDRGRVRSWGS